VVLLSGEGRDRQIQASPPRLMEGLTAEPTHAAPFIFCSPQHTDSAFYIRSSGSFERAAGFAHGDHIANKAGQARCAAGARPRTSRQDAALLAEMLSLSQRRTLPPLWSLFPNSAGRRRWRALGVQLETLARSSPVLMIFEDAHWGDPPPAWKRFGRTVGPESRPLRVAVDRDVPAGVRAALDRNSRM